MPEEIVVVDKNAVAEATAEIAAEESAQAEAVADAIAEVAIEAAETSEATAQALTNHTSEDEAKWHELITQIENQNQKINQLSESLLTLTNLVQAVAIAESPSTESPSSTPPAEETNPQVKNPTEESHRENGEDGQKEAKTETEIPLAIKRKRIIRLL